MHILISNGGRKFVVNNNPQKSIYSLELSTHLKSKFITS